jgi:hypothetical protein
MSKSTTTSSLQFHLCPHVTHVFSMSLTAYYEIIALLYKYGLTGLQVPILGTLWFAASPPLYPLIEGEKCIGWDCVLILLNRKTVYLLFVLFCTFLYFFVLFIKKYKKVIPFTCQSAWLAH